MQRETGKRSNSNSNVKSPLPRRRFLSTVAGSALAITLTGRSAAALERMIIPDRTNKPVRIGLIADLHHDIMHDGLDRLNVFVQAMAEQKPDAILQLGDFAYPNEKNRKVIDRFNQAHKRSLHVIGNHDTDSGHTKKQCVQVWKIPARYYTQEIEGIQFVVLDGNDRGSPKHKGGYPSFVGPDQITWLKKQLATLAGPIIVVSHQPLAGHAAIDNADEVQTILSDAADKVILSINGHTHIDHVLQVKGINYLHVNSASYYWVGGGKFKHESYAPEVHAQHPWISHTCPYRDSLFSMLTIDPQNLTIQVKGRRSEWVGKSPPEIGKPLSEDLKSEAVTARIRDRQIKKSAE